MKITLPDLDPFRHVAKLVGTHPYRKLVGVIRSGFMILRVASSAEDIWMSDAVHSLKIMVPVPDGTEDAAFICKAVDFFGQAGLVQSFKKEKSATLVLGSNYLAITNGKDQASTPADVRVGTAESNAMLKSSSLNIFTPPAIPQWHKAPLQIIKAARNLEVCVYQEDGRQSAICGVYFGPEGIVATDTAQCVLYEYPMPTQFALKSNVIKDGLLMLAKGKEFHYGVVERENDDSLLVIRTDILTLAMPCYLDYPIESVMKIMSQVSSLPEKWPCIEIDRQMLELKVDQIRVSNKTHVIQPLTILVRPTGVTIQQGYAATTVREMQVVAFADPKNWNGTREYALSIRRDLLYRIIRCAPGDVVTLGVSPQADRLWLVNRHHKYAALVVAMK